MKIEKVMLPYVSFDSWKGKDFQAGKLSMEDRRTYTIEQGEPKVKEWEVGVFGESGE